MKKLIGGLAGLPVVVGVGVLVVLFGGCRTAPTALPSSPAPSAELSKLVVGDGIRVSFPGAAELDSLQRVGPDGRVVLPLIGAVPAEGRTLEDLQAELSRRYATELQESDVVVTLEQSARAVSVTGSVLSPSRIPVDRQLSVLEVIMQAGGFDPVNAKTSEIVVIRHLEGERQQFILDLSPALKGRPTQPFYVQPGDIIFVPKRTFYY